VFADPSVRARLAAPDWQAVRAVREGHVRFAPAFPFGWVEDPPSLNRLLGGAWLSGGDAATLAATFADAAWGRAPSAADLAALRHDTP
jgi:iron complex transport system substrate-binding protein